MPTNQDNNSKKIDKKTKIIIAIVVIIIIAPVLIYLISRFVINNTNDNSNAEEFVLDAKSYVISAEEIVNSEGMSSLFGDSENKYSPKCNSNNEEKNIKLIDIINYGALDFSGPYGSYYDVNNSFVKVKAIFSEGTCDYKYYIYLTDGTYSIGTSSNPIIIDDVTTKSIKK